MLANKLMRQTFLILILLFSVQSVFSQMVSEALMIFEDEVTQLLVNADRNKTKGITLRIKPFQLKGEKGRWERKIKYTFLNDTIIKQKLQGDKYFGLIKAGQIIYVENDKEHNKVSETNLVKSYDSAGYKISTNKWIKGKDTNYFYSRTLSDRFGRIIESISVSAPSDLPQSMYKNEYEGDTLQISKHYSFINNSWTLTSEWTKTKSHNDTTMTEIYSIIDYNSHGKGNTINSTHKIVTFFSYDNCNRLISVEKYEYNNNEKDWSEKHLLIAKYIEK